MPQSFILPHGRYYSLASGCRGLGNAANERQQKTDYGHCWESLLARELWMGKNCRLDMEAMVEWRITQ